MQNQEPGRIRQPQDVVGWNRELLAYFDTMPGKAQLAILESGISISTLGELKLLEAHYDSAEG